MQIDHTALSLEQETPFTKKMFPQRRCFEAAQAAFTSQYAAGWQSDGGLICAADMAASTPSLRSNGRDIDHEKTEKAGKAEKNDFAGYRRALEAYLNTEGLKSSKQRDTVCEAFFRSTNHISVDELLGLARETDPKIGQATVYRTLKLLTEAGLAEPHRFFDEQTLYEPKAPGGEHHDHLICTKCGLIKEFLNEAVEALQIDVAREHGMRLTDHRMELFGECLDTDACTERAKKASLPQTDR